MHVFNTYNQILGIINQIILTLNHILIFDNDKIVSFFTVSEKKAFTPVYSTLMNFKVIFKNLWGCYL